LSVDGWKGTEPGAGQKKLLYGVRQMEWGRGTHRYFWCCYSAAPKPFLNTGSLLHHCPQCQQCMGSLALTHRAVKQQVMDNHGIITNSSFR